MPVDEQEKQLRHARGGAIHWEREFAESRVHGVPAAADLVSRPDLPEGSYTVAMWSPDGRSLLAPGMNGGLSNVNALYVIDAMTGAMRNIVPTRDLGFAAAAWSGDSRSVVAVVRRGTATTLERFALAGASSALPFAGSIIKTRIPATFLCVTVSV